MINPEYTGHRAVSLAVSTMALAALVGAWLLELKWLGSDGVLAVSLVTEARLVRLTCLDGACFLYDWLAVWLAGWFAGELSDLSGPRWRAG